MAKPIQYSKVKKEKNKKKKKKIIQIFRDCYNAEDPVNLKSLKFEPADSCPKSCNIAGEHTVIVKRKKKITSWHTNPSKKVTNDSI